MGGIVINCIELIKKLRPRETHCILLEKQGFLQGSLTLYLPMPELTKKSGHAS